MWEAQRLHSSLCRLCSSAVQGSLCAGCAGPFICKNLRQQAPSACLDQRWRVRSGSLGGSSHHGPSSLIALHAVLLPGNFVHTYSPGTWHLLIWRLLTWHLAPGTYSPGNWHLITWLPQSADTPVHTWGQADCPTPWEHWLCPPRPVFFRPSSVISDVIACSSCYNWSHAQPCFLFQHCFQNNFIRYNRKSQQGRLGLWICYHDCLFDVFVCS